MGGGGGGGGATAGDPFEEIPPIPTKEGFFTGGTGLGGFIDEESLLLLLNIIFLLPISTMPFSFKLFLLGPLELLL